MEYEDILKQECLVWVEVECTYSVVWPILRSAMEKLGTKSISDVYSLEYCYKEAKLFTDCMLWYASYVFSA